MKSKFGALLTIPALVGLIILIGYPLFYNFYVSFLRYDNLSPVTFNGLANYQWLFSTHEFYRSLRISTVYSLGSTALALLLGFILAYCITRIKKAETLFRVLAILPWAIPLIISGFMWKWILGKDLGVANYLLSILDLTTGHVPFLCDPTLGLISGIVATAYIYTPFMFVYLLAGMETIPSDLYDVAKIDGADNFQIVWYITLPLIKRPMMFACLLTLMFTFRTPDVFFSLTKGGPGKATYHLGLFLMDTIYKYFNFGHGAAIGVVILVIIIFFAFPGFYYVILKPEGRR